VPACSLHPGVHVTYMGWDNASTIAQKSKRAQRHLPNPLGDESPAGHPVSLNTYVCISLLFTSFYRTRLRLFAEDGIVCAARIAGPNSAAS